MSALLIVLTGLAGVGVPSLAALIMGESGFRLLRNPDLAMINGDRSR